MCFAGVCFWHFRELKSDCCTSRHLFCEKIFNFFKCVEVRILVEKCNIYEAHIFPRSLVNTCWLETTSLWLNTPLSVNKKFSYSQYFYWNLGNLLTFMSSPHNDKYNLSYSRTQHSRKRQLRTWFLCVSWCSFFAFWGAENNFFTLLQFGLRFMY